MSRPLIGITTRLDLAQNTFYLRRYYAEAIFSAGGDPFYIPLIPDEMYFRSLTNHLDGLMLSGSNSDLDPIYFGEEPHLKLGAVVEERDKTDLLLLKIAEEKKLPVLGICFGAQSIAVSRDGSLLQDVPSQIDGALKHDQGEPYNRPSHHIKIEPNSILSELANGLSARVNTSHHQAINTPGENLKITARAHDGVVECVEDTRENRFVLGVQWHPEVGWEHDELSKAIFQRFISESTRRQ